VETEDAVFDELIEKSSLGTAGARQLRARTPQSQADVVRQIINLRNAMAHGNDHETARATNMLVQLLDGLGYGEQARRVVAEAFPGRQADIIMTMARLIAHSREVPQQEDSGPGASAEESPGQEDLSAGPSAGSVSFANLDAADFEEFCYDLLTASGFVNVDWRKGTPREASPADRGRDIVAQLERVDVDGHRSFETWFVECKHYKRGVPPEALQSLTAWSESERPDVALVITSGFLSNPAKEWLGDYGRNRQPPFRIRHWEKPTLARMLGKHPALLHKHGIALGAG
jgi:hypothetical protein